LLKGSTDSTAGKDQPSASGDISATQPHQLVRHIQSESCLFMSSTDH